MEKNVENCLDPQVDGSKSVSMRLDLSLDALLTECIRLMKENTRLKSCLETSTLRTKWPQVYQLETMPRHSSMDSFMEQEMLRSAQLLMERLLMERDSKNHSYPQHQLLHPSEMASMSSSSQKKSGEVESVKSSGERRGILTWKHWMLLGALSALMVGYSIYVLHTLP